MTSTLHPDIRSPIIRQRFAVTFEYAVAFTRDAFDPANSTLADAMGTAGADPRPRCLAFVDMGVLAGHPALPEAIAAHFAARDDLPTLVVPPRLLPGGEAVKNDPALIGQMHDAILGHGIDRHSYVLAVGGGAFLDAVGLAASTAHRGVRLVRMPTTVLAQNDSGVGVKSAINLNGAKNQIGTFAPPWAVVNDAAFLDSLPQRDRIAGMAEAVKVALIRDGAFFEWLERSADALTLFEPEAVAHLIRRCAELHMRQITGGGDPFEQGSARPLDFGHWAAHKLETLSRNHLRHGEAVAVGIALDTRYSVLAGLLPEGEDLRVAVLLEHLGFRLWHPALARVDAAGRPLVLAGLEEFREHLGGRLTITLLAGIGRGIEVNAMDAGLVESAIGWLSAREAA
ncbi:3-dehydroquinate synthase [Azospirillum lipoferum]|uniref:3-dehydroquinate synthase n=1 Tax=Azospirillum lipoferum TaxID=193 RepID=A0A5A9G6B8_AZOLI|nr:MULTISPECIES: 3-dehydroquinate synthase [Azospirillum]KAA0589142.1 3-dehydroquinate synthase [Azospirillum lipoferum]MCP1613411.1 3-dehydroquinate synthase [Azospirillum lipoferum]MDW5533153.1 3-dehydroquinate synthase [Azospirillum sp. NL1]